MVSAVSLQTAQAQEADDAFGRPVRKLLAERGGVEALAEQCETVSAWHSGNDLPLLWPIHARHRSLLFRLIDLLDASLVANAVMLSNVADLTDVLSAMAKDGQPVSAALVASISPYIREHIRRFGRFALDMENLPNPLNPQPLPFEIAL